MKTIYSILNPSQHCEDTVMHLLTTLNIKFTKTTLQKQLTEHPDYPSMMSIADVIGFVYNVASISLKISRENIFREPEIQVPFLAQIKSPVLEHEVFVVVKNLNSNTVEVYRPDTKKTEVLSVEVFDNIYEGTILAVAKTEDSEEKDYLQNLKSAKRLFLFQNVAGYSIPITTVVSCILMVLYKVNFAPVAGVVFTLLTFVGCLISLLLLWREIDQSNPIVHQFCQMTTKINCSAILESGASKIFGVSWSSIGMIYFMGMLISILTGGASSSILTLLSWLNIVALPYVIFSIYYQWRIAKQWCLMCLAIQALLLLQFTTAFFAGLHNISHLSMMSPTPYMNIGVSFLFVSLMLAILIPVLHRLKENEENSINLNRLKHNPQVFEALLYKQKTIMKPPAELGITIGNPHGIFKLIKVCNPYCPPCARAHSAMDDLLENNDEIGMQILFNSIADENDMKWKPVMHLLSISANNDELLTQAALDDWYNAPTKDYDLFAKKYPFHGDVNLINEQIQEMSKWCEHYKIISTPTFFINISTDDSSEDVYYQLPRLYDVGDLKYFLTM